MVLPFWSLLLEFEQISGLHNEVKSFEIRFGYLSNTASTRAIPSYKFPDFDLAKGLIPHVEESGYQFEVCCRYMLGYLING